MTIRNFNNISPDIGQRVYIDPQSAVIGDVKIGDDSSIWPFTVVRGDVNHIRIGKRSNIQDNSTIHVSHDSHYQPGGYPTLIGDDVTVGHQVILHACTIGSRCLIGMGSLIMDNVKIEDEVIVGAGSLVTQNNILESGYLYLGRPVRRLRKLSEQEIARLEYSAQHYVRLKDQYL